MQVQEVFYNYWPKREFKEHLWWTNTWSTEVKKPRRNIGQSACWSWLKKFLKVIRFWANVRFPLRWFKLQKYTKEKKTAKSHCPLYGFRQHQLTSCIIIHWSGITCLILCWSPFCCENTSDSSSPLDQVCFDIWHLGNSVSMKGLHGIHQTRLPSSIPLWSTSDGHSLLARLVPENRKG